MQAPLVGSAAVDREWVRIGEVRRVFLDDETERPAWASVRATLLGSEVLVPLEDAAWDERALRLAVAEAAVLAAPSAHGDEAPTRRERERLLCHYGIPTLRFPREEGFVLDVPADDVSYSVRDASVDLPGRDDEVRLAS